MKTQAWAALMLLLPGAVVAQDRPASGIASEVAQARDVLATGNAAVRDALAALRPEAPGWTCARADVDIARDAALGEPAFASFDCLHGAIKGVVPVTFVVQPGAGALQCRDVDRLGRGDQPNARLIESGPWRFVLWPFHAEGCAGSDLSVRLGTGLAPNDEAAWPAAGIAIEALVIAILGLDPEPALATARALDLGSRGRAVLDLLAEQSEALARVVVAPPGATLEPGPRIRGAIEAGILPPSMAMGSLPAASATLERDGCRVHVVLSAGPMDLIDRFGPEEERAAHRKRVEDGDTFDMSAFTRRDTSRLWGKEAKDGSRVELLVDDAVGLTIFVHDGVEESRLLPCEAGVPLLREVLDGILAQDLSGFAVR